MFHSNCRSITQPFRTIHHSDRQTDGGRTDIALPYDRCFASKVRPKNVVAVTSQGSPVLWNCITTVGPALVVWAVYTSVFCLMFLSGFDCVNISI
jgi:hypothetical protein